MLGFVTGDFVMHKLAIFYNQNKALISPLLGALVTFLNLPNPILARGRSASASARRLAALFSALLLLAGLCVVSAARAGTPNTLAKPASTTEQAASANPRLQKPLQWSLLNASMAMFGLPGLVSPVDGRPDEGLGFHADGTTRRAGGEDSASGFNGQRAASYARTDALGQQPWLYDNIFGVAGNEGIQSMNNESGASAFDFDGNIFNSVLQRGISTGMGLANSAIESSILGLMGDSPYGSGKARLNFYLNLTDKGKTSLGGEGDILWPLYDNPYTTIYTQVGLRSMYSGGENYGSDRWIGNAGVGQRWFPGALVKNDGKTIDSGNWMFGYNTFYDYDFSRTHQRGGLGLEAQYDWLKMASNLYLPLSNWKNAKDFDGNYIEERAARGWDLRGKGYLPFYREVAITGAYTQWYGENVGMFGPSKLEKDPKIWSYGLEYTPVPALTAFVNQRQSEQGNSDTEFGLRFTYHFGLSAEDQFKPSRVAEMRTVQGSRHDFVDRENKIILEYQAKKKFQVDFIGLEGVNTFRFRVLNGFNKTVAGQIVTVSSTNITLAEVTAQPQPSTFARVKQWWQNLAFVKNAEAASYSKTYITDARGEFVVKLQEVLALPAAVNIQVGETSLTVPLQGATLTATGELTGPETIHTSTPITLTFKSNQPNMPIAWEVVGPADFTDNVLQTSEKGEAQATLKVNSNAEADGVITVTATVDGHPYNFTTKVPFEATLAADSDEIAPDGTVTFTLTSNKPVTSVTWGVSDSATFTTRETSTTGGSATATLKANASATSGSTITVTAYINNQPYTYDVTVTSSATLTANSTLLSLYGTITFTLTSNQPNKPVTWAVKTGSAQFKNTAAQTNENGRATATLQLNADAKLDDTITVTAAIDNQTPCEATLNVPFAIISLTADGTPILAGNTVTLTVASNQPTANMPVEWSVANGPATFIGGQYTASKFIDTVTNASGEATATIKISDTANRMDIIQVNASINREDRNIYLPIDGSASLSASATEVFAGETLDLNFSSNSPAALINWKVSDSSLGSIEPSSNRTNGSGGASATFKAAPTTMGGMVTITTSLPSDPCAEVRIQVKPNVFTLEAKPNTVTQNTATPVVFTVKKNDNPIISTLVTFSNNSAFTELANDASETTDATEGKINMTLTGTQIGEKTIEAQVANNPISCKITVEEDNSYNVVIESLTVTDNGDLTATVLVTRKRDNAPVTNMPVALQYNTYGGKRTPTRYTMKQTQTQAQTDASGKITIKGNVGSLPRQIAVKAKAAWFESEPKITTVNPAKLPKDFLTGLLQTTTMTFASANKICTENGGQLPMINNYLNLSYLSAYLPSLSIGGFGHQGDTWPPELPNGTGLYLTNTIDLGFTTGGKPWRWYVAPIDGIRVEIGTAPDVGAFAVCVP